MLDSTTGFYWGITGALGMAAIGSYAGGFLAAYVGRKLHIMDRPGSRSSHSTPTPRTGGMAILLGTLMGLSLHAQATMAFVAAAVVGAIITTISFLDDIITIPSLPRLAGHFVVAGLTLHMIHLHLPALGLPYARVPLPEIVGFAVGMVFVVGFVNFYNFMDGINGLAAAQGVWGGLTLAILLAWGQHGQEMGNSFLYGAAIAGGSLGFIPHNFPKARIFMGDIGSTTIGFVLAVLTLLGSRHAEINGQPVPWVAFVMPLGVFLYDATFTLFKRIARRENFLKAHREHHYQLLVRCGWSHAKVTALQMGLMTLCSIGALLYAGGTDPIRLAVLVMLACVFVSYSVLVHRYFNIHRLDAPTETPA
ncbi:MAG: glycosyltransferase family 4 protein [Planctomycetes bacterium]|nr:glycosyltransferase family 4 protein [Planctomycetota bacterium]